MIKVVKKTNSVVVSAKGKPGDVLVSSVFGSDGVLTANKLNLSALPTSALGLSAGDVWNDAGTLKIV
jgi:hypothetical protein